ncbi:MAG: ATP-binding protein [Sulfuricella sp.]
MNAAPVIIQDALRELSALVYAVCDGNGVLLDANRGFLMLGERDAMPAGEWDVSGLFVNPPFSRLAATLSEDGVAYRGILNIGPLSAVYSVHGMVYREGERLFLVAEHDVRELSRLNRSVIELNEEMAQIERDLVRKNQLLALAQSQLVQTEKMASIGQLAAGVAHEINNPIGFVYSNLTSLEGYLRDLFSALDACARGEEATRLEALWQELDLDFLRQDIPLLLGESRTGIARVKDIVQNLRDFAHIDGDSNWQWETLPRCLDSTLEVLRGAISGKIEIVREYGETPEIECQPSQLNQAFMNILLNAAQSIEGKGVIRVRTGQEGEQVRVEISDSGSGIAPDILPRIFEPFFTTRPVGTGTGLGLSAAFNIIAQHQGRIEAESTPGKGTLVRIRLPIRRQAHD